MGDTIFHNRLFFNKVVLVIICVFCTVRLFAQSPAFPGAEGFGKYTTGGRGGRVLLVENLNDSGPGSLRDAIAKDFPRIIVFKVSGNIALNSPLVIAHGDLTIAGQSAPGDGICLKNYVLKVKASNVIIRYIRSRMGDEAQQEDDCLTILRQKDIIVDHCSFSWGTDEVVTCYDNENFTLQYCIISESLNESVHAKGNHGYGGIWGGNKASFHHNLLACHASRNPRFCGARYHQQSNKEWVDFRNNVIFNWGHNNVYGGEKGNHNMVNNYFKAGPASKKSTIGQLVNPSFPFGKFFLNGNYIEGFPEVSQENSLGVKGADIKEVLLQEPFEVDTSWSTTARTAYEKVLQTVGMSLARDDADRRIIAEVRSGQPDAGVNKNGIINSQTDVGGWPALSSTQAPLDSDRDGIPDYWELEHGLDPQDPNDQNLYSLSPIYTNIEIFLNEIIENHEL
ncbi:pectate lyase [Persicobacter diffluens]|uniref:Pectate lyase n=1 Tax=Persicobacter diffluens TaxID=981 RepID=A0AAN5AMX2_9BACT|nr:pectate lyase [Persicobacter diffluens]